MGSGKRRALAAFLAALGGGIDTYNQQLMAKKMMEEKQQQRAQERSQEFSDRLNFEKQMFDYKNPLEQKQKMASFLISKGIDPNSGQTIPEYDLWRKNQTNEDLQKAIALSNINVGGDASGTPRKEYLDLLVNKTKATTRPKKDDKEDDDINFGDIGLGNK